MESTLLGLFLYDSDRGLTLDDGDPLGFDGFFEGETFEGFFHLEPTLFNLLRFFQLSVFRHSLLTQLYLHPIANRCYAEDRKRGHPFFGQPLVIYWLRGQDLNL